MWKRCAMGMAFVSMALSAMEYEVLYENDEVSVVRMRIAGLEELAAHRDAIPQWIYACKGGVITRIEEDGREVDVEFPTGAVVFRDEEPLDAPLHRALNKSIEPIKVISIQKKSSK